MKDYEEYQGYTDIQGSRDAIRKALQMDIIEDATWMSTTSSRNLTSHCYDEEEFNMVLNQIIHDYVPIFVEFSKRMNSIKRQGNIRHWQHHSTTLSNNINVIH